MTGDGPAALSDARRDWLLTAGDRYWPRGGAHVAGLELPRALPSPADAAAPLAAVALPDWAVDLGVDGALLVDAGCLLPGEAPPWQRCDWLAAAFLHLTGAAERAHEARHGPIHSYAFRLAGVDGRRFDRAWVNRIFLLLRRMAAREAGRSEAELFGPLPAAEIVMTHDVDAFWKTPEIRVKQTLFHLWNAARAAGRGEARQMAGKLGRATRFACLPARFDTLGLVARLEAEAGLKSLLHVYGGPPGFARGTARRILIDPAYDVGAPGIAADLRRLARDGWSIGLHQSSEAWRDAAMMRAERERVEAAVGVAVTACRQHWLRFAWDETWAAQAAAGLALDSTLGFNDRPGFRNGAALRVRPWSMAREAPHAIEAQPMVLMDSHLYDYQPLTAAERTSALHHWLGEVRAVGGIATVNWHTHTLTDAYGWGDGFAELLAMLR